MLRSLSKKAKKVIEESVTAFMELPSSLMEVTRIGARLMLQSALEEEVTAFLERDWYERKNAGKGSRNGYKHRTVKTGSGDIEVRMPQVRGSKAFHSLLLPPWVKRMKEVEELVPLLYMNGVSTRKVKKTVGKLLGKKGFSHENVSRISGRIVEEFRKWKRRDLSGLNVLYLILDGVRLGVRGRTREKEAVLVAWAFLEDGSRELIGVSLGNQESYGSWKGFLDDLTARGMNEPLLTVIDGCPGLIRAVEGVFPGSDIQRCTKHRTENVLEKVLKEDREKVKDSVRKIFYAPTETHAREAIELFKRNWGKRYPSATERLLTDIEACLTYYKYPYRHWKRLRTTNVVERSFREVKRRTKTAGRFNDEERALTMVYWQLKELRWNGVSMTGEAKAILASIKNSRIERMAA